MDSTKTVTHLNWLVKQTDEILEKAKSQKEKIEGAINWADLFCYQARYIMTDDGDEYFEVMISECDPAQKDLWDFVCNELRERDIHLTYPVFEW